MENPFFDENFNLVKVCPKCKAQNPENSKKCKKCKVKFITYYSKQPKHYKCWNCGQDLTKIKESEKIVAHCTSCGASQELLLEDLKQLKKFKLPKGGYAFTNMPALWDFLEKKEKSG